MDLEGMMLSEIHQIEIDKYCILSLVYGLLNMKQTNAYKEIRFVATRDGGEGRGN